ncbi:GNAT family N-acetyltransferase [Dactylosporangium sp. CA-139114]|uniref:GNAT family N-acetyltransferase n=1 Tax=Dactylosporangium sp. CA-139114 TaxID=3239931 RepID=UPI003D95DFBD
MTSLALSTYDGPATRRAAQRFVDLYRNVFTEPPWHEDETRVEEFRTRLTDDTHRPGFRAVVAHLDGCWIGFTTAWPTQPPFPTNRAYGTVRDRLGPDRVDELLVGALEIDEVAVSPAAQGRGVGGRLLDATLATAPDCRAWLLTWTTSPQAIGFYTRQGWRAAQPVPDSADEVVVFLSPEHPGSMGAPAQDARINSSDWIKS